MIVVAIIAILASVVVPSWFRESRTGKARSEVSAMFAELATKEEQYYIDNNQYLQVGVCPSAPVTNGQDLVAAGCMGTTYWQPLRVVPPSQTIGCTYEIVTGPNTVAPAPPAPFVLTATPTTSWFYIVATCDADGDPGAYSQYFTSNLDQSIQKFQEGN